MHSKGVLIVQLRAVFSGLAFAVALWLTPQAADAQEARDCSTVDWSAVGYADAEQRGSPADATSWVDEYRHTCIDVVGVDEAAYESGFIRGLTAFCTPRRAFDLGRAGQTYVGWCPADQAEAFALGLRDGRRVRVAEAAVNEVASVSRQLRARQREMRDQQDRAGANRATSVIGAERSFQMGAAYQEQQLVQQMEQTSRLARIDQAVNSMEDVTAGRQEQLETLRAEYGDRYGEW